MEALEQKMMFSSKPGHYEVGDNYRSVSSSSHDHKGSHVLHFNECSLVDEGRETAKRALVTCNYKKPCSSSSSNESGYLDSDSVQGNPRKGSRICNGTVPNLFKEELECGKSSFYPQHDKRSRKRRGNTWKVKLNDIKSFTTYSGEQGEMSAREFLIQFEKEAELVGVPEERYLKLLSSVLRGPTSFWFRSNARQFWNYQEFKEAFLQYYQSEGLVCTSLARLRTSPFDPKIHKSVEGFINERYYRIKDLDPWVSKLQLCLCLITLLPVVYQRHLASARITSLKDMLDIIRRLEAIYQAAEMKKDNIPRANPGRLQDQRGAPRINAVYQDVRESEDQRHHGHQRNNTRRNQQWQNSRRRTGNQGRNNFQGRSNDWNFNNQQGRREYRGNWDPESLPNNYRNEADGWNSNNQQEHYIENWDPGSPPNNCRIDSNGQNFDSHQRNRALREDDDYETPPNRCLVDGNQSLGRDVVPRGSYGNIKDGTHNQKNERVCLIPESRL